MLTEYPGFQSRSHSHCISSPGRRFVLVGAQFLQPTTDDGHLPGGVRHMAMTHSTVRHVFHGARARRACGLGCKYRSE